MVQRLSLQVPEELTNRRSEKRVGDWCFVNQPRALDPLSLAAMPLLQRTSDAPGELSRKKKVRDGGKVVSGQFGQPDFDGTRFLLVAWDHGDGAVLPLINIHYPCFMQ